MDLLARLVRDRGQTVVLVTHDLSVAAAARRTIRMRDGVVQSDSANNTPEPAARAIPS
jgi:predicted ABC-type transport system involved in lysophospholipase L1 biosynthesis ATPase subunit